MVADGGGRERELEHESPGLGKLGLAGPGLEHSLVGCQGGKTLGRRMDELGTGSQ